MTLSKIQRVPMKNASRFTVQRGWKITITDMGINPAHVLALAGLPADLFTRNDASLSPKEYFNLWHGLEKAAGAEELPLKIGRTISVEAFDPPIFASLCSPNLNTALQRLAQYKPLIGPLTMKVDIDRQQTIATLDCYGHSGQIPRSLGATELVFLTQLARLATRETITPVVLKLPRLPANPSPYESYFGNAIEPGVFQLQSDPQRNPPGAGGTLPGPLLHFTSRDFLSSGVSGQQFILASVQNLDRKDAGRVSQHPAGCGSAATIEKGPEVSFENAFMKLGIREGRNEEA